VIDTAGRARRTVDIKVGGSPMMHNFSLTESHVVLYDFPVTSDTRQAVGAAVPAFAACPRPAGAICAHRPVRIPNSPLRAKHAVANGEDPTTGEP
jgi:carotenoid cleavage dioxygenase